MHTIHQHMGLTHTEINEGKDRNRRNEKYRLIHRYNKKSNEATEYQYCWW